MEPWTPSIGWLDRHDRAEIVYRVRLRFADAALADATWEALATTMTTDELGDLLAGGVALSRAGARCVDVISGGEDALDSLTDGIHHVAEIAARRGPTPDVVAEERTGWLAAGRR